MNISLYFTGNYIIGRLHRIESINCFYDTQPWPKLTNQHPLICWISVKISRLFRFIKMLMKIYVFSRRFPWERKPLACVWNVFFCGHENRRSQAYISYDMGLVHKEYSRLSTICMMTSSSGNIFRVTGPLCGEFTGHPTEKPVTRGFDVFFDLRPNKRLSKQSWGWWFETPLPHYDVIVMGWSSKELFHKRFIWPRFKSWEKYFRF